MECKENDQSLRPRGSLQSLATLGYCGTGGVYSFVPQLRQKSTGFSFLSWRALFFAQTIAGKERNMVPFPRKRGLRGKRHRDGRNKQPPLAKLRGRCDRPTAKSDPCQIIAKYGPGWKFSSAGLTLRSPTLVGGEDRNERVFCMPVYFGIDYCHTSDGGAENIPTPPEDGAVCKCMDSTAKRYAARHKSNRAYPRLNSLQGRPLGLGGG